MHKKINSAGFTWRELLRNCYHYAHRHLIVTFKQLNSASAIVFQFSTSLKPKLQSRVKNLLPMLWELSQKKTWTTHYQMSVRTLHSTVTYSKVILFILELSALMTHFVQIFKKQSTCYSMVNQIRIKNSQKLSLLGLFLEITLKLLRKWLWMPVLLTQMTLTQTVLHSPVKSLGVELETFRLSTINLVRRESNLPTRKRSEGYITEWGSLLELVQETSRSWSVAWRATMEWLEWLVTVLLTQLHSLTPT